ncbi:hypothetical protein AB6806_10900 [Bosea sp. RCC_152_1]|uniref:hypothetical protein n=1 Tax=Bosea sp. RCC_152_1 TaxID=3239228 RepID=UPI0035261B1C
MISLLKNVFRSAGASVPSSDVEQAIGEIDQRIAEKTQQHETLSARRLDVLIEDEVAAAKLRRQIADLGDEIADLAAARERVVRQLDQARSAEAATEARRRYAAAAERRDTTVKALRQRLPKHLKEHLALLRLIEETRAVVAAANAELPVDAAYIEDAEGLVRDRAPLPEEVLDEKPEIIWRRSLYPHEKVEPAKVERFKDLGGGKGEFYESTKSVRGENYPVHTEQRVECTGYIEVTRTIRAAQPGESGARLRRLAMPGFRWCDPGYELPSWHHNPSPEDVLSFVAKAEAVSAEPQAEPRKVRTEQTREDLT